MHKEGDARICRGSSLKFPNIRLRSHERLLCVSTYCSDGVGLGVRATISWRTSTSAPSPFPFVLALAFASGPSAKLYAS